MQTQKEKTVSMTEQENYWLNIKEQLRRFVYQNVKTDELEYFVSYCRNINLNPLYKEIYFLPLDGKYVPYISNIGLRILAVRSGEYQGETQGFWCGEDGHWKDVWLSSDPPAAAKIGVYRRGFIEPLWFVATYKNFAKKNKMGPLAKWRDTPDDMLLMRAESGALRRAFPEHLPVSVDENDEFDDEPLVEKAIQKAAKATVNAQKEKPDSGFSQVTNNTITYKALLDRFIDSQYHELELKELTYPQEQVGEISSLMGQLTMLSMLMNKINLPEADCKNTLEFFEQKGLNESNLTKIIQRCEKLLSQKK